MSTTPTLAPAPRKGRHLAADYIERGLPDPRPVTDYTAVMSTVAGASRLTITLAQPCVVRTPMWPCVDVTDGHLVHPTTVTIVSNTTFYFEFGGLLDQAVSWVQVPYMDTQVQNFQGGFVRPGGQWFRAPK